MYKSRRSVHVSPYAAAVRRYELVRRDPDHPDHRDAALALALICRSVGPVESDGHVFRWDFASQSLYHAPAFAPVKGGWPAGIKRVKYRGPALRTAP